MVPPLRHGLLMEKPRMLITRTSATFTTAFLFLGFAGISMPLLASDWPQFRGPNSSGVSPDSPFPATWSDSQNLRWKTALPGRGSSSPIVWGKSVYVTSYSGYGDSDEGSGNPSDLKRHLLCLDRSTGKILWDKTVDAVLPEDRYGGQLTEHGYASSTPATDGQHIYCFFGKSGVVAFDTSGTLLWQTSVGTSSANRRWGSAASPILYKNMLIINASEESQCIYALDKANGKVTWKAPAPSLELTYGTPLVSQLADGHSELEIAVPGEVWGLNPDSGKLIWYSLTSLGGNIAPSLVAGDGLLFAAGCFPGTGATALRPGGKDDVTKTHTVWTSRTGPYVPSPLYHDKYLYLIDDRGGFTCVDAATGHTLYTQLLPTRGRGKPFYASPVLADNKIYAVSRTAGTFVLAPGPQFHQLSQNRFISDDSDFNASPAATNGQIFLRSNRFIYCAESPGH